MLWEAHGTMLREGLQTMLPSPTIMQLEVHTKRNNNVLNNIKLYEMLIPTVIMLRCKTKNNTTYNDNEFVVTILFLFYMLFNIQDCIYRDTLF